MRTTRALPAALVAALAVGCATTTDTRLSPSAPDPSVSESPTSTPVQASDAPSVAPTIAAEPPRITWTEVPFDGQATTVIDDESRFVIVGQGADGTAAWTSVDGLAWEEHPVPDHTVAEPNPGFTVDAMMGRLVRLGDTLYSFGGASFIDTVFLVAWRWTDGGAWELIESDNAFFDGGSVWAVEASDVALIASRTVPYGFPTAWRWTADTSWQTTGLASTADAPIWIGDIEWLEGTYVATGYTSEPVGNLGSYEWPRTAAIWTSSNGLEWTPAPPPDGATAFCALNTVPGGGFVALGSVGERPAAWTSPDGRSWTEGSIEAPPGILLPRMESPENPCQLISVDGGLLAAVGIPGGAMVSWVSIDGRDWIAAEQLAANGTIASLGDQLVLVGGVPDPSAQTGVRQVVLRGTVSP